MPPIKSEAKREGFTRGEKCIFAHLVVTFVLILLVVLVYFVHLCLVRHGAGDAFRFTRRSAVEVDVEEGVSRIAGAVLIRASLAKVRVVCGCVALRPRWSAVPGHCAAARTEPALATYLPAWSVRYHSRKGPVQETFIARSIVHSQFVRYDMQNNIGLFEHTQPINVEKFRFSEVSLDDEFLYQQKRSLSVSGWQSGASGNPVGWVYPASPVKWETCRHHLTPVTELRHYEMCAMINTRHSANLPPPGAALVADSDVLGFFSWGDKHGRLPLVVLNLTHFRDWIEGIVNE